MVLWLALRFVAQIILGVGVIFVVVQFFRHESKKLAIMVIIIGIGTTIITFSGCLYFAPSYAGVNIEHSDYRLIKRAVKDEKLLLAVNSNSTDTDSFYGQEAAIDLNSTVMHLHKNAKDCRLCKIIDKSLIFDIQFPIIDSHDLRRMVIYSNQVISNSIAQKHGSASDRKQIFDQMNQDAGFVR